MKSALYLTLCYVVKCVWGCLDRCSRLWFLVSSSAPSTSSSAHPVTPACRTGPFAQAWNTNKTRSDRRSQTSLMLASPLSEHSGVSVLIISLCSVWLWLTITTFYKLIYQIELKLLIICVTAHTTNHSSTKLLTLTKRTLLHECFMNTLFRLLYFLCFVIFKFLFTVPSILHYVCCLSK